MSIKPFFMLSLIEYFWLNQKNKIFFSVSEFFLFSFYLIQRRFSSFYQEMLKDSFEFFKSSNSFKKQFSSKKRIENFSHILYLIYVCYIHMYATKWHLYVSHNNTAILICSNITSLFTFIFSFKMI